MTIKMNDSHVVSISQLKRLLKVCRDLQFKSGDLGGKYHWINDVLTRFGYFKLRKKDKGIIRGYLKKMTGLSDSQLTRLIKKKRLFGQIKPSSSRRHSFPVIYEPEDIALLAETDEAHHFLSGRATKRVFEREFKIFRKKEFKKLKNISVSHLYNLRQTRWYLSKVKHFVKTKPVPINIGERRKPNPKGEPGYIRVDSVHQGDLDKVKGVYHINLVDEVTQWEVVGAAEKISERYLEPVLKQALAQFPFKIKNFHSDNGSEYINKTVAKLLNKMTIAQTKSRSRRCNDNALVETKNGSIVRKHMGYTHIKQKYAKPINQFYRKYFNLYLNYHRPSGFATEKMDKKGKLKKVYNVYLTPFEAFKRHPRASKFLKKGVTFKKLEKIAKMTSDNECAEMMQKEKQKLFKKFK